MTQETITPQQSPPESLIDYATSVYQVDPISLRRVFLLLLRNHYSDPNANFGVLPKAFYQFHYSDSADKTLAIDLDYAYNPEEINWVPSIYIGVGSVKMGEHSQVMDKFAERESDNDGKRLVEGHTVVITITHVARKPEDSLMMGVLTSAYLNGIRDLIRKKLGLKGITGVELTSPRLISENKSDKLYRTDFHLSLAYTDNWITNVESHRIKKVDMKLLS